MQSKRNSGSKRPDARSMGAVVGPPSGGGGGGNGDDSDSGGGSTDPVDPPDDGGGGTGGSDGGSGSTGEPNIRLTTMSILGPSELTPGQTATVKTVWLNDGSASGSETHPLRVNGTTVKNIELTLGQNESTSVETSINLPEGTSQVTASIAGDSDTKSIQGSGELELTGVDIQEEGPVESGSTTGVRFSFVNTGVGEKQADFPILVDGEQTKSMDITLLGNSSDSLTVDVTVPETDTLMVESDGLSDTIDVVTSLPGPGNGNGDSGDPAGVGNLLTNPAVLAGGALAAGAAYIVVSGNNVPSI